MIFFGSLLTGMLTGAIGIYLRIPFFTSLISSVNSESEAINITLYVLGSYFAGLLLHGVGSLFEKFPFGIRKNVKSHFLDSNKNKVFTNPKELTDYQALACEILHMQANSEIKGIDQEYVFGYCNSYLEASGKYDKLEIISSQYVLNRNLAVSLTLCLIFYIITGNPCAIRENSNSFMVILALIAMIFLLFSRAKTLFEYRIRFVLNLYNRSKESGYQVR